MEYLVEYGLFFAKVFTIIMGLIVIISVIASTAMKAEGPDNKVEIKDLNKKYNKLKAKIQENILSKKELKKAIKSKESEKNKTAKDKIFVIDFVGDIKASHVDLFRDEISTVLSVANSNDEVVIRLESPGGMVHSYGLAASQMKRVKDKGIKLTACVDKVAASGGYLMACTADKIISAPFAIIGSIGVLAQVPNAHRFLKKHDIDYNEYTAGEYKRTISLLGEITEKGKEKFITELEETHTLFKNFVKNNRPSVNIDEVATGEHWYGSQAKSHNLVDEIMTSDNYLLDKLESKSIIQVKISPKKTLKDKLSGAASLAFENSFFKLLELNKYKF